MGDIKLVCSFCGSDDLVFESKSADPTQAWAPQSSIDPRWPMAHCRKCDAKPYWKPVISERAFHHKTKRSPEGEADQHGTGSMTEAELKRAILDLAYRQGWEVFHMTASVIRGSQGRGYPDLTLARRHEVLFMELKTDSGKVSDDQWRWGIALPEWHVIRPADWNDGRVAEMLR